MKMAKMILVVLVSVVVAQGSVVFYDSFESGFNSTVWTAVPGQGGTFDATGAFGGAPGEGSMFVYSGAAYPGNFVVHQLNQAYYGTASIDMTCYLAGVTLFRVYSSNGSWADVGWVPNGGLVWWGRTDQSNGSQNIWTVSSVPWNWVDRSFQWNKAYIVVDQNGLSAYGNSIDAEHLVMTYSGVTDIKAIAFGDPTGGAAQWNGYDGAKVEGVPTPEPATLSLLILGAMGLIRRK